MESPLSFQATLYIHVKQIIFNFHNIATYAPYFNYSLLIISFIYDKHYVALQQWQHEILINI